VQKKALLTKDEYKKHFPTLTVDWSRWQSSDTINGIKVGKLFNPSTRSSGSEISDSFDPNDPDTMQNLFDMMRANGEQIDSESKISSEDPIEAAEDEKELLDLENKIK